MAKLWYHGTRDPSFKVKPFLCVTPERWAAEWYGYNGGFFHIHSFKVSSYSNIVDEDFLLKTFYQRFSIRPRYIPEHSYQNFFNIADDLAIRACMIKSGVDAVLYNDYGPAHNKEVGIIQEHTTLLVINKRILTLVEPEMVKVFTS